MRSSLAYAYHTNIQSPSLRLDGPDSNSSSIVACCFSGDMQVGQWTRCPRRFLTKELYSSHAKNTAVTLSAVGLWNWLGDENMMVDVYEHISNTFCQLASTAEKAPLFSASTSCHAWSAKFLNSSHNRTYLLNNDLCRQIYPPKPDSAQH